MNIFKMISDLFSLESKTIEQLIDISSYIDSEKSSPGIFINSTKEEELIASLIVALQNEPSMQKIGNEIYNHINRLIVEKNSSAIDSDENSKEYERLKKKLQSGTFKIRQTRAGYKFDFVAYNGECLASSDIYSTIDSCYKGIMSTQRNSDSDIENQTEENYKQIKNPKYEVYIDKAGEYRFRLKSGNGQIIIYSEGYATVECCLLALAKIKETAFTAEIEKL